MRPTFLEIMNRLSTFFGGSGVSHESSSSSSSSAKNTTYPSSFSSSITTNFYTNSSTGSEKENIVDKIKVMKEPAPQGAVAIVTSDISGAAALWEADPLAMRDATLLHNELMREQIKQYSGYEVLSFSKEHVSGQGYFCIAFQEISDALEWCIAAQQALFNASWPESILSHPEATEEGDDRSSVPPVYMWLPTR